MTYILVFLASVLISSLSQVLLKISAEKEYSNIWQEYLNLRTVGAYGLFFLSTLITVFAYKYVSISLGAVLEASGYIFVTIFGMLILKEKVGKKKLIGLTIILLGILVFNIP